MQGLPDRIWIVGVPGAGKSTLAATLGSRLGIEPTSMDEIHWLPGWRERPAEETRARLAERLESPRWIVEGNYGQYRLAHMDAVELTIWLDLPLRVTFPRLIRRCLRRAFLREACCNGNRESLRLTFLDRESLLLYALQTDRRRRRGLEEELMTRPHLRFRSQREVDRWLAGAGGSALAGDGSPDV